jgi:hypothetical protein
MPRKGPAYPITPEWQGRVRDRIDAMIDAKEVESQNEVARNAGIAQSSLSGALKKGAVQSTVMREIHKALGWPPPLMCPPVYVLQLVEYFQRLSELDQGRWLERMRNEVESARSKR